MGWGCDDLMACYVYNTLKSSWQQSAADSKEEEHQPKMSGKWGDNMRSGRYFPSVQRTKSSAIYTRGGN